MSLRYGPPEVVRVVDDAPDARGRRRRPARAGPRDHGQPHRLRLPRGVAVLHPGRSPGCGGRGLASGARSMPGSSSGSAARSRASRPVTESSGMPRGASARTPSSSRWRDLARRPRARRRRPAPPPRPRPRAATTRCRGIRRAGIEPGQRVLVHGATGAIGSAAVQLLADLGVHVIATAPTAHVELVRGLGAERVVDHEQRGLHPHRRDRRCRPRHGRARAPSGPAVASSTRRRLRVLRPRARSRRTSRCRS